MPSGVRKVVIPVAGMGTRFLPVTKAVPKEILPIGTIPTLHMVVEEAADSGISEIILVSSPAKCLIEEYFETGTAYERALEAMGNLGLSLKAQGRLPEAEPLLEAALEIYRRILGNEHRRTLQSMNNLAQLLQDLVLGQL